MALRVLTEKALALAMAVAVAVTQLHGGGAQTPASVQYVASPAGNFFVVPGKSILPWDAFALLGNTDSWVSVPQCPPSNQWFPNFSKQAPPWLSELDGTKSCFFCANQNTNRTGLCKASCWAAIECVAWSFVTLADGSGQCRLANEGPTTLTVPEGTDATYYFKESAVPGVYSFKVDRLLYLTPSMQLKYEAAKAFCARIPGHRLGMYKTIQQLDMLEEYWCLSGNCPATLYMYLEKTADGVVFGDGTPFSSTEIAQTGIVMNSQTSYTFIFYNKRVDDATETSARPFLCQANPNGVDW
ncbi:uncharacterized protein LOC119573551 [Penaeus monodon]|uniref:uncharacterized protein LOC119573551 n=1 Tax=Penaeus monodon TaxID=6687 RepID=UPI0018A75986|nr:uncharacterized protein LOC119573551 [Penaeus monodon]